MKKEPTMSREAQEKIVDVSLSDLVIDPANNCRKAVADDDPSIVQLAESIKIHGMYEPIGVQATSKGKFVLVYGYRRCQAWRVAGLEKRAMKARLLEAGDREVAIANVVENIHRSDLTPPEIVEALRRLSDHGFTNIEICRETGYTESHVSNMLSLSKRLTPELKQAFADQTGEGGWHVQEYLEVSKADPKDQAAKLAQLLEGKGSGRKRGARNGGKEKRTISVERARLESMVGQVGKAMAERQLSPETARGIAMVLDFLLGNKPWPFDPPKSEEEEEKEE